MDIQATKCPPKLSIAAPPPGWLASALRAHLCRREISGSAAQLGTELRELVRLDLDRIPLPGRGETLERWRALAVVGAHDLGLAKLYEGHTDALAILAELRMPIPATRTWGVWAAESSSGKLLAVPDRDGAVRLRGRKTWCSGATVLSHALVTAWMGEKERCLVAVPLAQETVRVHGEPWQAIGMGPTGSVDVNFSDTLGTLVGNPGEYLSRPGFWHGGAGIAACWYGAAAMLGETLRQSVARKMEPLAAAHLGAVDIALLGAGAVLRDAAVQIDAAPSSDAFGLALRVRGTVENAANLVLQHASRALGAGPLCRDPRVARHAADLPIFLRQSHAERDLAELGAAVAKQDVEPWML